MLDLVLHNTSFKRKDNDDQICSLSHAGKSLLDFDKKILNFLQTFLILAMMVKTDSL